MPDSVSAAKNDPDSEQAPSLVQLPPEQADFFETKGYSGSAATEDRIAARLNARCTASMEFLPPPLALINAVADRPEVASVLVKDLSKTGVCILAHCQIYPTERAKLFMHGRELNISVHRCRRLGEKCYEVGAAVESVSQT
ncbi:MAG: hypothetical protein Aurels2KO_47430 [Aureliella sp.]